MVSFYIAFSQRLLNQYESPSKKQKHDNNKGTLH